jgi:hypothetical protein
MDGGGASGKQCGIGDFVEVGGAREDAPGFFAPVSGVADALEFSFDGAQDMRESVLAAMRPVTWWMRSLPSATLMAEADGKLPTAERISAATIFPPAMPRISRLRW